MEGRDNERKKPGLRVDWDIFYETVWGGAGRRGGGSHTNLKNFAFWKTSGLLADSGRANEHFARTVAQFDVSVKFISDENREALISTEGEYDFQPPKPYRVLPCLLRA